MMVFPRNQIDGKWTINQARGFSRAIGDRFDLTLECIRRHYVGERSPLSDVLARYTFFFDLFGDFAGYVDFFLLNDLVTHDAKTVLISQPFDDFRGSPIPATAEQYKSYEHASTQFIRNRNRRMVQWVNELS